MVQNLDGYCPFELKAGLGVLGAGLGVQGAQAVRRAALGAGAGRAGRWPSRRRALVRDTGRHVGRRARGAREAGERCFVLISMPNSIPKRRNYGRLAL